jgi:spore coat polysaccharide biosynthesis protein SpsF
MNIVAIVQARMGSNRLPGKIVKPLGDKLIFEWVYERIKVMMIFFVSDLQIEG